MQRQAETGEAVIEFENAAYSYGGGTLISGISLRLAPGSFHFLTGPSGAGKTTFLRLCHGELRPTEGRIAIFEGDSAAMSRDEIAAVRQRIGIVHQDCQFLDHLPLSENVTLPLTVSGRESMLEPGHLDDLLAWVGLSKQADALPPELSGGERQRAALARAIVTSPDVILADEPTGNVDWEMAMRLLQLLVQLNRMGKAVVIATHDLNLIRAARGQVTARVLRIRGGRVESAGAEL